MWIEFRFPTRQILIIFSLHYYLHERHLIRKRKETEPIARQHIYINTRRLKMNTGILRTQQLTRLPRHRHNSPLSLCRAIEQREIPDSESMRIVSELIQQVIMRHRERRLRHEHETTARGPQRRMRHIKQVHTIRRSPLLTKPTIRTATSIHKHMSLPITRDRRGMDQG
jgi:hypothetical protein